MSRITHHPCTPFATFIGVVLIGSFVGNRVDGPSDPYVVLLIAAVAAVLPTVAGWCSNRVAAAVIDQVAPLALLGVSIGITVRDIVEVDGGYQQPWEWTATIIIVTAVLWIETGRRWWQRKRSEPKLEGAGG